MESRWKLHRVGLLNFWYYQNQIFQLASGKMLLRGTNGSGKSLTMQSLFPVLFDGDTSAYRLDSFGSRDRKMEDYLLGEKGVSNRDEGIGYLFLEVKRKDRDEYLTVGIGMHAHRGGKLNKWFFAIENNQRIGMDFELFEELRKGELTPLTKKKLRNRLEGKGRLFDSQRAYKTYVNQRIFGFETMEQFEELISLLINLRSPKLSKEFRPSVIYGILRDSLPKLKEDDLLTLSKTIEQLDGHRERLEDLDMEWQELNKFSKVYRRWQAEFVGQIADKWLQFAKEKQQLEKEQRQNQRDGQRWEKELTEQQAAFQQHDIQIKALTQSIQELNQHEGMDLVRRGQELKEQLEQTQQQIKKNQEALTRKQQQLDRQRANLEEQLTEKEAYMQNLADLLEDNQQYLSYLRLDDLDKAYTAKIRITITKEEFSYWTNQVKVKKQHFQEVIQRLQQLSYQQEQLVRMQHEEGQLQQVVDELLRELRQWQQTRHAEVERMKKAMDSWQKTTSFPLSEKDYAETFYQMDQLLEEYVREEFVLAPLTNSYQQALTLNQQATIPLVTQKENHQLIIEQKKAEIQEWQNQKMPEVEQRQTRKESRVKLAEQASFLPFYQGVDFLDHVSQEEKNHLEGALFASGILDSLISEEGLHLADDSQILPQPKFFATTLADYLEVNTELSTSLQSIATDVLQSVVVDELDAELPSVFCDGTYQLANVRGGMPTNYQASFIGVASQERYRQTMIAQLEAEIANVEQEIQELEQKIAEKEQARQQIITDYQNRPNGEEVYEAIHQMERTDNEHQLQLKQLQQKQAQTAALANTIKTEQLELHRLTHQDGLFLDKTVYEEAAVYADNYEANLTDSYQTYLQIQGLQRGLADLQLHVSITMEEEEELLQDSSDLRTKKQREQRLVEENRKQQQLIDVEELQAQLSQAITEQKEREEKKEVANQRIRQLTTQVAVNQTTLNQTQEKLTLIVRQESNWQQLFQAEVRPTEEQSLMEVAESQRREPNIKKLKDQETAVIAQFNYLADRLQNYQPQLLNLASVDLSEEEEQALGEFGNYNNYKQPRFTAEGQRQTVYHLLERLSEQKLTLQDLLKKDDEKLFKTIILESVGNILRSRINQAMKWVEQMNQLLQSQKNSSGLSLSIQWKPNSSASDQDLGTSRLVALLQKPTELLSQEDRGMISQHFQEKVYYAQEQLQENEENQSTLFQSIAQVLDYRDWFEFELRFKRANEGYTPQALTDRRFNQFSGGEKAIAMYLPLFAAVYSRYLDAEDFCPKVITLDEAFAGIDDLNIAELFKACEQLGFNYVMNSQALFGDYPTVSQLMIYELLRPQNMNLVTAIQYHWDGHQKQFVLEGVNDGN